MTLFVIVRNICCSAGLVNPQNAPLPDPMRSQRRHDSGAQQETNAPRYVVPQEREILTGTIQLETKPALTPTLSPRLFITHIYFCLLSLR